MTTTYICANVIMSTTGCFLQCTLIMNWSIIFLIFLLYSHHDLAINQRTENTIKKKDNNDVHNTTHKTKDRATQTPLKPRMNSCALNIHIL